MDETESAPPRRMLVVDAANVVGSKPDGWWRDRAGAATRLLAQLSGWQLRAHPRTEVVVVLEGAARSAADAGAKFPGVTVVSASGSGDDAIVGVVAAAGEADPGRPVTVVTADRELRGRVEALGADTVGPSVLRSRLDS